METELKSRETLIQQLEGDINDLRYALEHEKESRALQVKKHCKLYIDMFAGLSNVTRNQDEPNFLFSPNLFHVILGNGLT